MKSSAIQEKPDATAMLCSETSPFMAVKNQPISLAGAKRMAAYELGANGPWPDQGLNRVLAAIDSFDSGNLSEVECLEMLFYLSSRRPDSRRLAESAMETYGSLAKVFARSGKELRENLGLDHSMTAQLAIWKTTLKYALLKDVPGRKDLSSYAALMDYLTLGMREAEQEILRVIYLDAKNRIIKDEEMARGTVDAVSIYPKEIAKRAMAYCASSIILAHNHLSDDPTPSNTDIQATVKTKGALGLLDIVLHDHVIIARNHCFSMQQQRLI